MAYVTNFLLNPMVSIQLESKLTRTDLAAAASLAERARLPDGVRADELPNKFFWGESDTKMPTELPDMIRSSYIFVSESLANLLSAFDLGRGFLWDVEIYEYDESTPADVQLKGLHVGTFKSSLIGDQSPKLREIATTPPKWMFPHSPLSDDDVTLNKTAEQGADLWRDEASPSLLYFSQKLGDAIREAGLAKELKLIRCALVD